MFWVVERNFLSSWLTWYRKGKRPHLQCRQLTKCQKVGLRSHDFVALPLETRHECDEDQIWKIEEKSEKCSFLGGLYWWKADFTVFKNHSKCRIWIFQLWHFPPTFVLLQFTRLVTLFDGSFMFSKTRQIHHFWHFKMNVCPLKM